MCAKDDPTVTKGYFPNKRGKTGRQKAWAYVTDTTGKIQQLLALEYGSGKMKLYHCLPSLLEKIIKLFGLESDERRHLRKRIVIRIDAADCHLRLRHACAELPEILGFWSNMVLAIS